MDTNGDLMKIAMIGWEYPPYIVGGLGKHCYNLVKSLLEDKSNEIHFFSPQFFDEKSYDNENFHMHKISGIVSGEVYSHYSMNEDIGDYAEKISLLLNGIKPDIVHGHDWISVKALEYAHKKGYKTVLTLHSLDYMRSGVKTSISKIEKEGCETADKIITVSSWMKEEIVKNYNIEPEKIKVVYNGIEKAVITKEDREKAYQLKDKLGLEGKDIVFYLGRLTLQKGAEYILYAAKKMKRPNTVFLFGGRGNIENLESFARTLDVNAKFVGYIPEDEKKLYYLISNVFVSPSLYEPFGIAIGEALSFGVPVIATQSGITELLKKGRDYILFKKRDSIELAKKISELLDNKMLAIKIGRNGKKAVEGITWKKCSEETMKVYNEVGK